MRHRDRVQRSLEFVQPESEEFVEHRKLRAKIVVLPDIGLQQRGVIRQAVENVSCRQPVALDLTPEIVRDHNVSSVLSDNKCRGTRVPIASSKDELNVHNQSV